MNVLAIGCHPDDIEISCCGTLAKCVKRGDKVTVCHVANGNMGHEIISPEDLRIMRREEARRAGALAGIEVVTIDVGDLLPNGASVEQRDKIAELIIKTQPDFIITHSPTDYMPDHREVSKLVFDASFVASVPQYGPAGKAAVTPIYYMDNLAGMNFNPTENICTDLAEHRRCNTHFAQVDGGGHGVAAVMERDGIHQHKLPALRLLSHGGDNDIRDKYSKAGNAHHGRSLLVVTFGHTSS